MAFKKKKIVEISIFSNNDWFASLVVFLKATREDLKPETINYHYLQT
jgi:hypothetical protein